MPVHVQTRALQWKGKLWFQIGTKFTDIWDCDSDTVTVRVTHGVPSPSSESCKVPSCFVLDAVTDTVGGTELVYKRSTRDNPELSQYHRLCNRVISEGESRDDRTGVGTISVFGATCEYDISDSVPLFTSKHVPWKLAIDELLWVLRGDTDAANLNSRIWDGNTSRAFLDSRGLQRYRTGLTGPLYGWQLRYFGARYDRDTLRPDNFMGIDQLEYVLNEIRTNPTSRRIVISLWNPLVADECVLRPCHYTIQFFVRQSQFLDCMFTMRSNDLFLGHPFNVFEYAVLTYILAAKTGLKPGKLVYTSGDTHVYQNHTAQVSEMLGRDPQPFPKLVMKESVATADWNDLSVDDFQVKGYLYDSAIPAPMAV